MGSDYQMKAVSSEQQAYEGGFRRFDWLMVRTETAGHNDVLWWARTGDGR